MTAKKPEYDRTRPELVFRSDVVALTPTKEFLEAAEEYGLTFDDGDLERFGRYLAMLAAANEQVNLTAITAPGEMWMKHILDSLTLIPLLSELGEGAKVADVGSGAGLPGIPLAIALPGFWFTLIEATAKKTQFISTVVQALSIENVEVLNERAEMVGQDWSRGAGRRESFDASLARAVGRLAIITELCVPLVKVGGLVLLTKGAKADEELAEAAVALKTLHASHAGTVDTPTGKIVVLEKTGQTPKGYPRSSGEPARKPIS